VTLTKDRSKMYFGMLDHTNYTYSLLCYHVLDKTVDTLVSKMNESICNVVISPLEDKIAFVVDSNSTFRCAIYDLKKKNTYMLKESKLAAGNICWSNSGESIFLSKEDGMIVEAKANGEIIKSVAQGYSPAISRDNRYIAYVFDGNIYVKELSSGKNTCIVSHSSYYSPQYYSIVNITWSPDGSYILFQGHNPLSKILSMSSQYVIIQADGKGHPLKVMDISSAGYGAHWVP